MGGEPTSSSTSAGRIGLKKFKGQRARLAGAVVALGIDIDGTKHPLSFVEGSTENDTLVRELLVELCVGAGWM